MSWETERRLYGTLLNDYYACDDRQKFEALPELEQDAVTMALSKKGRRMTMRTSTAVLCAREKSNHAWELLKGRTWRGLWQDYIPACMNV